MIQTDGKYVTAMLRADDRATFDAVALSVGLLVDDGAGVIQPADGASIDYVGQIVDQPAVLADDGSELTPATFRSGFHINLRVDVERLPKWQAVYANWSANGSPISAHKDETGLSLGGVSLIDINSVATPSRVWFGG